MIEDGDRSDKEYWNRRVRENEDDLDSVIWATAKHHRDAWTQIVERVLKGFADLQVVDVACGWGRFCHLFRPEKYFGFDFSEEMIRVAKEKFPGYKFAVEDAHIFEVPEADIIFQVVSAGNMKMTLSEFFEKYKDKARVAVISVDSQSIIIQPTQ